MNPKPCRSQNGRIQMPPGDVERIMRTDMNEPATSPSPHAPAATRTIDVKGQRLRVAIRPGDGMRTPLLLMNGVGANLELLQPFVDALDPAIGVIRFDVPG